MPSIYNSYANMMSGSQLEDYYNGYQQAQQQRQAMDQQQITAYQVEYGQVGDARWNQLYGNIAGPWNQGISGSQQYFHQQQNQHLQATEEAVLKQVEDEERFNKHRRIRIRRKR
jgi:hypothetical protein